MKIYEAYLDKTLRNNFKDYLDAEGHSVMSRDKVHYRFGVYLTRLKGVRYDKLLLEAVDEKEFRNRLEMIFYEKWAAHIGYPEMPSYFFIYLDFLKLQSVMHSDSGIEGLDLNFDSYIPRNGVISEFEKRIISPDKKLGILVNPALIRRLKEQDFWKYPVSEACIWECESFYKDCDLEMLKENWQKILEKAIGAKNAKPKKGATKVEITKSDGSVRYCNLTQAFEYVLEEVGIEQVAKCRLLNHAQPVVVKRIPIKSGLNFKELGNGFYLNCLGSNSDRFKTLRALISIYRLPMDVKLVTEESKHKPAAKAAPVAKLEILPQISSVIPVSKEKLVTPYPEETPFEFGKDGVLNLFDD